MSYRALNLEQKIHLAHVHLQDKENGTKNLEQYATQLGMDLPTLIRRCREINQYHSERLKSFRPAAVAEENRPRRFYVNVPRVDLTGQSWIAAGDYEAPDHSEEMVALLNLVAQKFGVKNLILGGDGVSSDVVGISSHDPTTPQTGTLRGQIDTYKSIIRSHLQVFEKAWHIRGNHDDMMARKTLGQIDYDMLLNDASFENRLQFSTYGKMYVGTHRGEVKVSHARKYSPMAINIGIQLYNSDPVKPHVVLFHNHMAQRGWTSDGNKEVICPGCMRENAKSEYPNINDTTFAKWNPGFVMCDEDGFFHTFTLNGTNWGKVLG